LRKTAIARCRSRGFTLVEITIVLVIVGLIMSGLLALWKTQLINAGISTTQQKEQAIKQALITYLAKNSALPCPADPQALPGSASYGVAQPNPAPPSLPTSCVGAGITTVVTDIVFQGAAETAYRGVVPFVTLGLPQDLALDGYNQRFTYVVSAAAIQLTSATAPGMRGALSVHTSAPTALGLPPGNQINACSPTAGDNSCNNLAVIIIVSHGQDTYGAYLPSGIQSSVPATNVYEQQNALSANKGQFVQTQFSDNQAGPGGQFDDVVLWLRPDDLLGPLQQNGTLKSAQGALQETSTNLKNTLIGYMLSNALKLPPPPLPNTSDPWGTNIQYTPLANIVSVGLKQSTPDGTAIDLRSAGPDKTLGSPDDIDLTVSVSELKGLLTAAGVAIPP
jgi:prepilin-type N-terminal cleavage/methylation domain-containing protein